MDDIDRLFQRLVQSIRGEHPEYLARPFEIAELYQKLVPYRHHRRELQIDTNQDYEAAVMRLLAGERGYLVGDEGMQEFLRTELASPNPDTTVFREFGSNHVAIAPGALERLGSAGGDVKRERALDQEATLLAVPDTPTPEIDTRAARSITPPSVPVPPVPVAPAPPPVVASPVVAPAVAAVSPVRPPAEAPSTVDPSPDMAVTPRSVTASDAGGKCRYCSGILPEGRRLVFCPHCGQNLTVHRCPACSTELELGWKFCVTCGRTIGGNTT